MPSGRQENKSILPVIALVIIAIVCGVAIGIVAGLVGIGGGVFVIALFNLGFGFDILTTTATSLFTVLMTSCSGAIGHIRNRTANLKISLLVAAGAVICSPLGALSAAHVPPFVLTIVTALIMLIPMVQMLASARKQRKAGTKDAATTVTWKDTHLDAKTVAVCIPAGMLAGFCSGLVGLGGGFIVIPILSGILHRGMHEVAGTSTCVIFLSSIAGTITHALAGDINWLIGVAIGIGSIPGALVGANLSKKIDGIYLKYILAGVLLLVSISLILRAVL